ncbi:hypothetical protein O6H91_08G034000 [Diphasiastrum complanatum]|uniref:Uncharacterized protein n=1 Tax=Diphasiastrum complanatum TaxID=34168 RepID=A0ACC2CWF0_DIPCM|nr:hypothetical protein O6H91_08G034000 [Diphasiastrum complanatum]
MAAFMLGNRHAMAALALCVHFLALLKLAAGREYVVGGRQGWILPVANTNYSSWALRHKYYVGDSLEFNYQAEANSVVQVNREHFDACNATDYIASYGNGKTVVELNRTGPYWFISGVNNNCNQGQKFGIMVFAKTHGASPPIYTMSPESAPAPSPYAGSPSHVANAPVPTNSAISLRSFTPLLLGFLASFSWWALL